MLNLINQLVVIWQLAMLAFMYFINLSLFMIFTRVDLRKRYHMLQVDIEPSSPSAAQNTDPDALEHDLLTQEEAADIGLTNTSDQLDMAIGYTFYTGTSSKGWKIYRSKRRSYFLHLFLYAATLLFLVLLTALSAFYLLIRGQQDMVIDSVGHGLGYVSSVVIFVQWIPQIVHTLVSKSPGNFSIVMMMLLCPGAFVNVLYLAATGQSVSTWFSYFVSGLQQIVLLSLLIYYSLKERLAERRKRRLDARRNDNKMYGSLDSPMTITSETPIIDLHTDSYGAT